ncbi:hypothetical protein ONS95_012056 [Cadophora gregata]|uniref:uncharacterized protein n=1 Tax=Cadophora gregata TaxID=51156 RepID=UPI0026DDBF31|nr:uncharacterized protein ONS95_012056 [Cadophora gregata]KAK0117728.1 hypothetical protein ONS95_012056 [Cadophora gregata]KAK0122778.1 hypothetical protein ONS96_009813 [Cadophora gregata f. sp. sojae]
MSYHGHYDEEDELDIRVRRGRASPQPVVYPEHRYRPAPRPFYESHGSSYLVPAVSIGAGGVHRSRSTGHRRTSPPAAAPQAPIVINNRIYNDYEDDDYLGLAPPQRSRSRSRSRPNSFVQDPRDQYELERARRELESYRAVHTRDEYEMDRSRRELEAYRLARDQQEKDKVRRELEAYRAVHTRDEYEMEKTRRELELYKIDKERQKEEDRLRKQVAATKEDIELEKTRKELQEYKAQKEKEAEEKRVKKEMELQRLKDEKKAEEEKKRLKKEADAAIEKYKIEEAEKAAKAKKEKAEREEEYQRRLQEDLRKSGMDERQIAVVLKKDKGVDPNRPTYTRMSRRHLSIETLNRYRIDYEFDQDPDYVLIKRWVPEYEQDFLWSHTREIRERRQPVLLSIEGKKHHHHETEFEFVRKKKHERKPSPSPLLTFLAGGKR